MSFYITPNVGDSRDWDKKKYKEAARYCRIIRKTIKPEVDRKFEKAISDLLIYGVVVIDT
jgi:hypothetical protein